MILVIRKVIVGEPTGKNNERIRDKE